VANGICIRLYDEKDFTGRPRFTDPEILRSSLAGVILRMKSLHLGAGGRVSPSSSRRSGRAIADGYQLLNELGAVDDAQRAHPAGHGPGPLAARPARGPHDPGSQATAGAGRGAGDRQRLSVQDVRDRPMDQQQQADQQHAKFDDEKSEFSGYLTLWKWLQRARGGTPSARVQKAMAGKKAPRPLPVAQRHGHHEPGLPPLERHPTHKLSNRQYEQLLRQNFINVRRVREWRDMHTQLLTVVAEHNWRLNTSSPPATSSCTCRCWRACWATSAASPTTKTGTWARAASSSTATPART
jgi:ATP-dependent helicase HrpA